MTSLLLPAASLSSIPRASLIHWEVVYDSLGMKERCLFGGTWSGTDRR